MKEALKRWGRRGGRSCNPCEPLESSWHAVTMDAGMHVTSQPGTPARGQSTAALDSGHESDDGSEECGGWRAIEAQRAVKVSDVSGQHFELDLGN